MSVSTVDIEKIARLARIRVTAAEIPELQSRLNNILAMVDALQAVDTQGIEPMANPHDGCQRLRADEVTESNQRDAFLRIAPQSEAGLYLVPKVIE